MTCSFCGKSIPNKNALWTHVVFKHPEEAENGVSYEKRNVNYGVVEIKDEVKDDGNWELDENLSNKDMFKGSEDGSFDDILKFKEEDFQEIVLSHSIPKKEESDNLSSRSSSSSGFIVVDPVFEKSGSDDSLFELPGFESKDVEKSIEISDNFTKLIKKKELEIEYENNIEDAIFDLAFETVSNDAIEDHIHQLEDYLKQVENTFRNISLGKTDFSEKASIKKDTLEPLLLDNTDESATASIKQKNWEPNQKKLVADYGFIKPF